jgi:type II secretory ATPase GspE/PulE/Tfp pilus assembly ATPase PilB-like protein
MLRRLCPVLLATIFISFAAGDLAGQELHSGLLGQSSAQNFVDFHPGAYLSWVKLLLVAVVFLVWIRMADWINRDSMKIGEQTDLIPEIWNPLNAGTFLLGFLVAISVPIFVAGFSIYLICAWAPFLTYFFLRRAKIKAQPRILDQVRTKPGELPPAALLPQDEGAIMEFSPAGDDTKEQQVNLIRARQSEGFPAFKNLINDVLSKRADVVLLDYTRDRVDCRIQVDGAWHAMPPLDRVNGDALLFSAKSLAGLNTSQRRAKQDGQFGIKTETEKANLEVTAQGVPTGERVQMKILRKVKGFLTLGQLGMFPEMVASIKQSLNRPGLAIISAPPRAGLTTSWQGALETTDRLTRDCVAIVEKAEDETIVENIMIHRYDAKAGERQFDKIKGIMLAQPDFIAMPMVDDSETMDFLVSQVTLQNRSLLLRTPAKSAAEALLKVLSQCGNHDQFATAVKHVTCQRLVRRLCDECKQEVRVAPKVIQQLGGDPRKQKTLFNQYQLPPPEQRVDEKGRPIEFPPCPICAGLGYIGRIGVYEMIVVNDDIRQLIRTTPQAEAIEKTAQTSGKSTLARQAYKLVLLGITSLPEVQRMLKESG